MVENQEENYVNVENELKDKFKPKKIDSKLLAESYKRLGYDSKYSRVDDCASWLQFKVFNDVSLSPKLNKANFCKDVLCPMCAWRRSSKMFAQVAQVMNYVSSDYRFVFLTLTCKNVVAEELSKTVSMLVRDAWQGLTKNTLFKGSIHGFFRALEITHYTEQFISPKRYYKAKKFYDRQGIGIGDLNPTYDSYHPHLHLILAVKPEYFQRRENSGYITHEKWCEMWQNAMRVDYQPWVDVRAVYSKDKGTKNADEDMLDMSAIAEVAKYSTKSADYLIKENETATDAAVRTLINSISGRRLISYGGVFKKAKEQLGFDDAIDGDLVHTSDELTVNNELNYILVNYNWNIGFNDYRFTRIVNIDVGCDE
jgi:plasmid rolling circle replication initiator protein Rep